MKFRDLKVGDTFDFIDDDHPELNSFFARVVKTRIRWYEVVDQPTLRYSVGSIDVEVFHVEKGQR